MTSATAIKKLKSLGACPDAVKWCKGRSVAEAWHDCERGDWMLWLCEKLSGEPGSDGRRKLVLCVCECARLALPSARGDVARVAIETAERWARGEARVELEDVRRAARAAAAAAAYAAAYAAYAAVYATAAAAYAAYTAAAIHADATSSILDKCAGIARRHYPVCPLLAAARKGK